MWMRVAPVAGAAILPVFSDTWKVTCRACLWLEDTERGMICTNDRADDKRFRVYCGAMRFDGACGPEASLYCEK
jgi:hypothetical protein